MSLVSFIHKLEVYKNQIISKEKNGGMVKLLLYW
jgi:hypothetical protein